MARRSLCHGIDDGQARQRAPASARKDGHFLHCRAALVAQSRRAGEPGAGRGVQALAAQRPASDRAAAAPQNEVQAASLALEALTLRNAIEEEQNEILRGLNTISARVVRVYPDGNMLVSGQKVDYRQRNQVRYVTTVQGVLRPADVSGENLVSATKLVNPEIKVRRQQSTGLVRERLEQLAPLIGSDACLLYTSPSPRDAS